MVYLEAIGFIKTEVGWNLTRSRYYVTIRNTKLTVKFRAELTSTRGRRDPPLISLEIVNGSYTA